MDELLSALRAAGERTRLRILAVLARGELTVTDLTRILGQSQPRISRHLKLLCEAGLLERHREGSWVLFRLAGDTRMSGFVREVVAMVPPDDPVMVRDLKRLEDVRMARRARAETYFNEHAGHWEKLRSLHVDDRLVEDALSELLGEERIGRLLDLGTGTGRMLELFAPQADQAIGIDSSQQMLAYARANLDRLGYDNCQVRHGDIFHLPYDDASQDVVIIHQVLHYIDDPAAVIAEAARALRPGGRLVAVDFSPHELEFLREEHQHVRLGIAASQMENWLKQAGLDRVEHRELSPSHGSGDQALTVSIWLAEVPDGAAT